MVHPIDPVKRIEMALDLGFPLSEAVHTVLGRSLAQFAREFGHRESEISMCLGGYPGRVYGRIRNDLASELEIGRRELDRLIRRARRLSDTDAFRPGEAREDPGVSGG